MGSSDQKISGSKLNYKNATSPIGIDIGSSHIKIVQLQQQAGTLSFISRGSTPTPEGAVADGQISDPEKLSRKLALLQQKLQLRGNQANLCLGPESHYLRLIELPPLSKKDLHKTLPWEIEKHFPLKTVNAAYDCCLLDASRANGNGKSSYILAAAHTDTANQLTGVAEKAGYKPLSLEVNPLSLLRVETLNQNGNPTESGLSNKALLDIGYQNSTLLLIGSGILKYCRQLRVGVLDFLKEISFNSDLTLTEALRILYQTDVLVAGSPIKSAELLAEQISGSIGHYLDQSGTGGAEPSLLAVSGGGAAIPGLIDFLHSKLAIKVEQQRLKALAGNRSVNKIGIMQSDSAIFATAFGLALRGWLR